MGVCGETGNVAPNVYYIVLIVGDMVFQYGGGMMENKSLMPGMVGSGSMMPPHAYPPQPPHLANGAINPAYHGGKTVCNTLEVLLD